MSKYIKYVVLIFLLCIYTIYMPKAEAATLYSASCSQSDVQATINSASDGDVVVIPSGNCTWASTVTVSNKSITIQGQSPSSTVITGRMVLHSTQSKPITLKDLKLTGPGTLLNINGGQHHFRVTNVTFVHTSGYAVFITGYTLGLIDSCTFGPNSAGASCIRIESDSCANAYGRDSALGTANTVYVEDCTFTRTTFAGATHAIWAQNGGSYCVRYCTIQNYDIDMHGHCSYTAGREFEIYKNNIIVTSGQGMGAFAIIRGGTGVIYDNAITNNGGHSNVNVQMRLQEIDWGGNCNEATGGPCHCSEYPCTRQIGRGKNDVLDPVYIWDNTENVSEDNDRITIWPNTEDTTCEGICGKDLEVEDFIVEDRDYVRNTSKHGYSAYTYPHPLTNTAATKLSAPSNLHIVSVTPGP